LAILGSAEGNYALTGQGGYLLFLEIKELPILGAGICPYISSTKALCLLVEI
jgi:hypothetical protein